MNDTAAGQDRHGKKAVLSRSLPGDRPQKTDLTYTIVPVLIIVVVALAAYGNALGGNFVFDDQTQIVSNPWIRDIRNIPTIFSKDVWSFGHERSNYYRPLMHIVFMLNYHLFGLKPWGFHLVNILLHCGVSVLVFLTARRLLAARMSTTSPALLSAPLIAAVLFAVYPIHTEAVTWISGLPDVSYALFYLLSFFLYLLFRDGIKRAYLLSVFSFGLATLFKEPALTLPLLLIAYDYLVDRPHETISAGIKVYLPYIIVSGVYLLARYHALRGFAPFRAYGDLSTSQLFVNVFPLFGEYLASLFWPFGLSVWHTFHPIKSLLETRGMIAIVITAVFFIISAAAYKKDKLFFFGFLLIVVPLLPVFYIKGIGGTPFAERYLYLPSVGFVLLVALSLSWIKEKQPMGGRTIAFIFTIVVAGLYIVLTVNRNNVWRDNFQLWSDAVRKSPDSPDAHVNLGSAYDSQGLSDKAIEQYRTALNLNPNSVEAHNNLAGAYQSRGLPDKAVEQYQIALSLDPNSAMVHGNLGDAYGSQGLLDKAIEQYRIALRFNPDDAIVHNNLANAYRSQGLLDKAIEQYQASLSLNPASADVHNNLGAAYKARGQLDKAIEQYRAALVLKPDSVEAHFNLGNAYRSQGLLDKAIEQYQSALILRPDSAEVHFNIGLIYLKNRSWEMARREFEAVLKINPDFDKARQALSYIARAEQ